MNKCKGVPYEVIRESILLYRVYYAENGIKMIWNGIFFLEKTLRERISLESVFTVKWEKYFNSNIIERLEFNLTHLRIHY